MLNKIHESHLGIVKCKERARDMLYWPGMSTHIEDVVSQCAVCNENKNSNPKEPLLPHTARKTMGEDWHISLSLQWSRVFALCRLLLSTTIKISRDHQVV